VSNDKTRYRVISVRVSDEEYEDFRELATARGVKLSDLLRLALRSRNLGSRPNTFASLCDFREVRYGRGL
jgi:hypothetical protein